MNRPRITRAWRVTAVLLVACLLIGAVVVMAATLQLPKGTKAKLKFSPGMKLSSGELSAGVPIVCYLSEPIQIGGKTVVEEGAQATARVVEAKKAGKGGKPGYIKIEFVELETKGEYRSVDGAKIKLNGYIENTGKGKKTLSYLFIFGLFISGGQGEIDANATYTVEVSESIILESK